jgi:hypothetical protein
MRPRDRFVAPRRGRVRGIVTAPARYLVDRRDAGRVRRSVSVASTALDWAALHGTGDPTAVRAILKAARRDGAVLRLAESRLVHRSHADTRARDALALVQLALDTLPPRVGA